MGWTENRRWRQPATLWTLDAVQLYFLATGPWPWFPTLPSICLINLQPFSEAKAPTVHSFQNWFPSVLRTSQVIKASGGQMRETTPSSPTLMVNAMARCLLDSSLWALPLLTTLSWTARPQIDWHGEASQKVFDVCQTEGNQDNWCHEKGIYRRDVQVETH